MAVGDIAPPRQLGQPTEQPVGRAEADRERSSQVAAMERQQLGRQDRGAAPVAEGEAGLGEEREAGRPHGVARHGGERVVGSSSNCDPA